MKAKFFAFDDAGKQYINFNTNDFSITENGESRQVTFVKCPKLKEPLALSSVLTIDVSGSMGFENDRGINTAKAAARAWINLLPLGKSECAITTFHTGNDIIQDFTTNRSKLLNALDKISIGGGTDFDAGFISPMSGALLVADSGKHKKAVVFLTDGQSQGDDYEIVQKALSINATIYCVVLNKPAPKILKNVAERTGGLWFENVTSEEEAEDIYRKILLVAQGGDPCEIEWKSKINCSQNIFVSIQIGKYNLSDIDNYSIPYDKIARLDAKPGSIRFESVQPETNSDTVISITAINSGFNISGIKISNPLFDINPKVFSLAKAKQKI